MRRISHITDVKSRPPYPGKPYGTPAFTLTFHTRLPIQSPDLQDFVIIAKKITNRVAVTINMTYVDIINV